jgi:hypothetical protein
MATGPKVLKDGTKVYGPYARSGTDGKRNDRDIVVKRSPSGKTTSTTAARHNKEQATGRKLGKDEHAAHKPGTNRKSNSASDTTVQKASRNISDGNKARKK